MPNPRKSSLSRDQEIAALTRAITHTKGVADRAKLRLILANRYREAGLWELAIPQIERAYKEAPSDPAVQKSVGLMQMGSGAIKEGLALYDRGRRLLDEYQTILRPYQFPTWKGEPLSGKTLLVWAEQGIGDQFMQARVLKQLVAMGADVTVEADPRVFSLLKPLLPTVSWCRQTVKLVPELVAGGFDYQTSMLTAWRFVENLHASARCAMPEQKRMMSYRKAWNGLSGSEKLNVGLSWISQAKIRGAARSVSLEQLSPLVDVPHMRFHSIQYDPGDPIDNSKAFGGALFVDSGLDHRKDLSGLFAHIAALDLVITIDNATAHFAGVLGVPCWVIIPRNADWRWGRMGSQTQLYPTLRLFRAAQTGSFADALHAICEEAHATDLDSFKTGET